MNDFDRVYQHQQPFTSIASYRDLAVVLNVAEEAIKSARRRGVFPLDWMVKLAFMYPGSMPVPVSKGL